MNQCPGVLDTAELLQQNATDGQFINNARVQSGSQPWGTVLIRASVLPPSHGVKHRRERERGDTIVCNKLTPALATSTHS